SEAFRYYRHEGVPQVICEQKHMGSRAVVIVCRDEDTARKRFGVIGEGIGICYTRTGRRFFENRSLENQLLDHVRESMTACGLWDEFKTEWACLDCELMPWSAKALELLRNQYAAVGSAGKAAFAEAVQLLQQAERRGSEAISGVNGSLLDRYCQRQQMLIDYIAAYRRYCWPVNSINDYKLAPFHLLATEGHVHTDKDHIWHMEVVKRLSGADVPGGLIMATPYKVVDVTDPGQLTDGVRWWEELTASGGEGMVLKPLSFIVKGQRGLVQPAIKCRGREYLRIIYGAEYTAPEHLQELRNRGLGAKRSLASREFALGIESLERFVRREPLTRVHECVFGVLALESEPVDPRL
ncbi:MAG TPA: polynucleotide kinase-phosphatase, partial [Phycisphaerae bacterium]|nr:polynucleotide kinase-phosphatase [Phycisphaerae bacterium]